MTAAFERTVAGDALQLAGLVRDHGPDTSTETARP